MLHFITNGENWPSEHTRGIQMAEYLGCKINSRIAKDDVLIYVKCTPSLNISDRVKAVYIDPIDAPNTVEVCNKTPFARVIVLTPAMKQSLQDSGVKNDIVVIPEHSCNFEGAVRERADITKAGYIGSRHCFYLRFDEVRQRLLEHGIEFEYFLCEKDVTRQQVVDFYKRIDIQIAFRPEHIDCRNPMYRNPLKIVNAGSFKIPTVAYPEFAYRTYAKFCYIDAVDLDDVIRCCVELSKNKCLYETYSLRAYELSQMYTIDKIAKFYKELDV